MTQTQSDRLKDVQRQYAEMEHHTATLQQAQQAAWVAENNYRSLTDKCREEFRVRQQVYCSDCSAANCRLCAH